MADGRDDQVLKQFGGLLSAASPRAYPTNISATYKSASALESYNNRLRKGEKANFVPNNTKWAVLLWDLPDNSDEFCRLEISELGPLAAAMSIKNADPRCRFIFIQTLSSRGPLRCSLDQLAHILTYHQVMPSILDFCFEFRKRGDPVTTNWLRIDDTLPSQGVAVQQQVPRSLGRSGMRIQHCFNIMAFEWDDSKEDKDKWPLLRHITAYHSFDIEEGRALWLLIKGDTLIRDRVTFSPKSGLGTSPTTQESFRATLKTHMQILEWCTENWGEFIEFFEAKTRKHSTVARHAPVDDLAEAAQKWEIQAMRRPLVFDPPKSPSRVMTGLSKASRAFSSLSKMTRRTTGHPATGDDHAEPTAKDGATPEEDAEEAKKREKLKNPFFDEIIKFEDRQLIDRLAGELETASQVINENLKILGGLKDRYLNLVQTKDACRGFASDVADFVQQINVLESDLNTRASRIRGLARRLEKDEAVFKDALEYRNMVVGVKYALAAKKSSDIMELYSEKMHEIAAKTEDKTVSMHVITVLGLLFLPGTFVSTLISSSIFDFDANPDGSNLGDWRVRLAALKIFLLLCILLMAFTVPIWWIVYKMRPKDSSSFRVMTAWSGTQA